MRTRSKLVLAALSASLLLAVGIGNASANQIGISETDIRAVFSELTFGRGGSAIICPVTIAGEFHRSVFSKEEFLLGYITTANVAEGECRGIGTARANPGDWHITFLYWTGTLPNIDTIGLLLENVDFTLRILGGLVTCRYQGPAEGFVDVAESTLVAEQGITIPLISGGGLCPPEGEFFGDADITEVGSGEPIVITLV